MPKMGYEKGLFDLFIPDFIGLTLEEAAKLVHSKPNRLLYRFQSYGYQIEYEKQSKINPNKNKRVIERIKLPERRNFLENKNKFGEGVIVVKLPVDKYQEIANTPRRRS